MQFARTILRNSAIGLAAQIAIKLLSFGFNILVIRQLGATEYGQYAAVTSFGSVFLFIADLGLAPYTVREVARLRDRPDGPQRIRALFGNVLALRLLLALLSGFMVVTAGILTGRPELMVAAIALNALNVLVFAVQGSSDAILQGHERVDLTAGVQVVNQVVFVTLGALALWLGFGYFGLIVATMAGFVSMATISWRAVGRLGVRPGRPTVALWGPLLRAALPFGVIGLTLGLSYRFDSVLLNIFWGDAPTGYYNAAYNLIFSLVTLSNVLNTALYPSLARQAAIAPESLPQLYERLLRYLLLAAVPIAVGGFLVAEPLVALLLGAEYAASAELLRVLIWVLPLMFCSEFLGYVVVIAGREAKVARAIVGSTVVNIAANLLLIPRFGPMAAAVVTVATELVLVGQYGWLLRDQLRQMRWRQVLGKPMVAVAAMATIVLLGHDLPVLLTVAAGGVSYAALLLALRVVGPDEYAFLRGLLGRNAGTPSESA